jgi:integrase
VLLGKYDTDESWEAYNRLLAEWKANGRRLPASLGSTPDLTVNELALAYWTWAEDYYRWDKRGGFCLKGALKVVKDLYGHTVARDFGPLALKACRNQMIALNWSRNYVNSQVNRLRRMFRWAAAEEMLPGSVHENLKQVEGLRLGKTAARDTKKIKPVPPEQVEATRPHLPPVVRAMVDFQLLTGCRPSEVCLLRPIDLDMHNPLCWVYRPAKHKTQHLNLDRLILIGPKAQEVLHPYMGTRLDAYCFSPALSEALRNTARRERRKSPMTPSQRARKPKANRNRGHRDRYEVTSYRNAIYRACDRAFPLPERLSPQRQDNGKRESRAAWLARLTPGEKEDVRGWRGRHRWHPNRLRHSRATELRPHGLDMVKTILGHTKVETSQIYAEKDLAAAQELVAKIG